MGGWENDQFGIQQVQSPLIKMLVLESVSMLYPPNIFSNIRQLCQDPKITKTPVHGAFRSPGSMIDFFDDGYLPRQIQGQSYLR